MRIAVVSATNGCPSHKDKAVTPYTIRHTITTQLLQSWVDFSVIALGLGYESPTTTHTYMEADLAIKRQALATLDEPNVRQRPFRIEDKLVQFLEAL
jgi:integrase/recombinase XerD